MITGLCHGVFDILHFGHIRHFKAARAMCGRLVVSVTADAYVNKGPNRPVFSLAERMEVVAAIVGVDDVIASHEATGVGSLKTVRPNIYFKDAEYRNSTHPGFAAEREFCAINGIRLHFTEEQRSSSSAALRQLMSCADG
ncbi:MAG: adenylyltransferase/cytidyltransferase family protein [Rhodospirillaceae bacterium]|nr:adenylyltransferase/cytidyltransferase family protein [Rhodospirillaceae bacterium]